MEDLGQHVFLFSKMSLFVVEKVISRQKSSDYKFYNHFFEQRVFFSS